MNAPQPVSPRQRLQELLAIPERERSDAQWDEINELEIKLASGNQQQNQGQGARGNAPGNQGNPGNPGNPGHPRPGGGGGPQGKRPFRKFRKRRPNDGGGP